MAKVIDDPMALPSRRTTIYPKVLSEGFDKRIKRTATDALGLTQFGINVTILEPGGLSSHRHYHREEDEAVYVLEGEVVLVTDEGERVLRAGAMAGFPRGDANGHHLVNRSAAPARYLEIGTRAANEFVVYSDVDLMGERRDGVFQFTTKAGEPYEP